MSLSLCGSPQGIDGSVVSWFIKPKNRVIARSEAMWHQQHRCEERLQDYA